MKMGTGQLASLLASGFQGRVYPVHPSESTVLGLTAYPNISAVPETPDLVVLVLPTDIVSATLDECGRAGVTAAIVVSGGFREVGGDGVAKERELEEVARRHGMTLIGPNCIGVSNFHIGLNTTYFPYNHQPGGVTVISQSGTYSCHIYDYAKNHAIGLSHTVSVGNSALTDISDCLEYFADEPNTKAIALYIEGITDGRKFVRAASEAVRKKPVVALYVGGTGAGARAGMSHTGALAGEDAIYDGMLRQAGVMRCYSIEELLDWSWALSLAPLPPGGRVCVLTNAGGPGASMADSCNREGLEVPVLSDELQVRLRALLPHTAATVNPVDMTFLMDFNALYEQVPRLLMESDEVDAVVMYCVFGANLFRTLMAALPGRIDFDLDAVFPLVMGMLEKLAAMPGEYGKPLILSNFWGTEDQAPGFMARSGVPVYLTPERAVSALAALHRRAGYLSGKMPAEKASNGSAGEFR